MNSFGLQFDMVKACEGRNDDPLKPRFRFFDFTRTSFVVFYFYLFIANRAVSIYRVRSLKQ